MIRFAVLASLISCSAASKPRPPAFDAVAGDLVIEDVTVVPMDRDGVLAHHSVVVRGDRIAAVVPAGQLGNKTGARIIDGTGKWLLPGLADMHVHSWTNDDLALFLAAGVTTVRNMWGSDVQLEWRKQIASGKLLAPNIFTAGEIIDGDPPIWPGSTVLVKPDDADRIVAEQKAKGYDFLKPYARLTREVYDALVAAGTKHGMRLAGHVPKAVGLAGVLAAKQHTIEHLDGWLLALVPDAVQVPSEFWSGMRDVLPKLVESRIPQLVKDTVAAGTWNCPTLVVMERMGRLDDTDGLRAQVRWVDKVPAPTLERWDPKRDFRTKSRTPADFETMRMTNVVRRKILAALAAGGAGIVAGTDTGNPYVIAGASLHDELELMVAAGMSRAQVLRAATANAAEMLGKRGDFGVVATGARADLILVPSDPLAGPLPLVPDAVALRGTWLPKADLEAKLAAVNAPSAGDRWQGVPALPVEGAPVHQAHYDIKSGSGNTVGEERLAVTAKKTISAQSVLDVPVRVEITYGFGPGTATVATKSSYGTLSLAGKVTGGKLEVTGADIAGKPVALSAAMPPNAFLAGPGIAGSFNLAAQLATMKVGERRATVSLELGWFPKPAIEQVTYDVLREPDAGGHRTYTVTMNSTGGTIRGPLVVDASGYVVSQSFGPPLDFAFVRR